jgi:hypothetical protein
MGPVFIDTNVPMYAAGTDHPLREPCQRVIRAIALGELEAITDVEVLQEILYRYLHIGQREKGLWIFDHFHRILLGHILPVEEADVVRARELAEQHPRLEMQDLIHLAVMEHHHIRDIVTADWAFDAVPWIRRIPPQEFRQAIK